MAECRADGPAIERAVNHLALFYVSTQQFAAAAPFWRRGVELLEVSAAPSSAELATYLHNMAATCLIPAGLRGEAHATLVRARRLYRLHFCSDAPWVKDVEEFLR